MDRALDMASLLEEHVLSTLISDTYVFGYQWR
jgi:hypothetical protein